MSASSDNEDPERNNSADTRNLRDLPEHENIVEHFYDPDDQAVPEKPVREKTPFSLVGNIIFLLTIAHSGRHLLAGLQLLATSGNELPAGLPPKGQRPGHSQNSKAGRSEGRLRLLLGGRHQPLSGLLPPAQATRSPGHLRHQSRRRRAPAWRQGKPDGSIGEGYMEIIIERYTGVDSRQTISLFLTPFQSMDPHNYMAVQTRFEFYNDKPFRAASTWGAPSAACPCPRAI